MMDLLNTSRVSNNTNFTSPSNKTNDKIYNKLFYVPVFLTIYSLVLLCAILGNCLVCYIVKANQNMHNVTNYLLVNLAVSDLIQALSTIFHVADFVIKDLNLGDVGCKFQINMFNIPYCSSVLTLSVVAFERYYAVCKPMRFQGVKKRIKWIIPSIWLTSFIIYIPTIYFCNSRMGDDNQLSCDCTESWPNLRAKNIYGIFLVIMLFVVPLCTVVYCYFHVIGRLRVAPPGEGEGNIAARRSRKKVVKMLLITLVVFFVCWTPYNILYFLKRLQVDYRSIYAFVWYPALLLAFLNCACNPIIYCLLGKNFREGFKTILCCWRHCRRPFTSSRPSGSGTPATTPHIERINLQSKNVSGNSR